ncbi:MAG: hypothetical protein HY650_12955 [Acidobacteria bacterium]|nr:hypothetical protein [Acidobacteriota bacterium]
MAMVRHLVIRSRKIHRPRLFGALERVAAALAVTVVLGTLGLVFLTVGGEQELRESQDTILANRNTIRNLQSRVTEIEQSKTAPPAPTPESIRRSLVKFETEVLGEIDQVQSAVILEVNILANQSGVALTEVAFNPIEQKGESGAQPGQGGGFAIFPGMEMNFTVQGSYRDVRTFLSGLEKTEAFVVINNLDLKSVEDSVSRAEGRADMGSTDRIIALGVNLSVYYARGSHG